MNEEEQIKIRRGEHPDFFAMDHSRLSLFYRCPAWYDFQYNKHLPRVSGDAAEVGSAAHNFMELFVTQGLEVARAYVALMLPLGKQVELQKIKNAIEKIEFKGKPYATERRFHFYWPVIREKDGKILNVQFEAKIDILYLHIEDFEAEVIDGKSGRNLSSNIDNDPQGAAYSLAVIRSNELEHFGITNIIFTQAQWVTGKLVSTQFSRKDIEVYERQLHATVNEIVNAERFRPRPGSYCQFCPYIFHCPVGSRLIPTIWNLAGKDLPVRISSPEEAAQVGEQVVYLDAITKRYRDALKGYLFANQADIEIDSGRWTLEVVASRSFEGGMTGVLKRHPEEADSIKESHYSKLKFERSD